MVKKVFTTIFMFFYVIIYLFITTRHLNNLFPIFRHFLFQYADLFFTQIIPRQILLRKTRQNLRIISIEPYTVFCNSSLFQLLFTRLPFINPNQRPLCPFHIFREHLLDKFSNRLFRVFQLFHNASPFLLYYILI